MAEGIYEKIRFAVGRVVDAGAHINAAGAAESIGKSLGLSDGLIQFTHIELRNSIFEPAFKKIPYNERIIFLPHCTRNLKVCKATTDNEGIHCKNCGACAADEITKYAKELGYKGVFIAPGGSMVKKIILKHRPKAVIGVCCFPEATLGFESVKGINIIPQAVLLLNDGCSNTVVNMPLVKEKMAQIDQTIIEKSSTKK